MHFKSLKIRHSARALIFFLLLSLLSGGCVLHRQAATTPQSSDCFSSRWPHENSDLTPDPALFFGRLNNGMRYVIMENREPKDRVGLYLDVLAGSLQEFDNQRGLAHFLEHMLFNGTTNFPPGTLVEYFQTIGMSFGSDSNAHTTYNETVYNLLLPKGDRQTLQDGLLVMSDYARGALLLESEVDRERGVILAEKRTRDSATRRVWEEQSRFVFAGTRVAERMPIGTEEVLRGATPEILRNYYDAWYHPENMILVIVGDVDRETARELVEKQFSDLSGRDVDKLCDDPGRVTHAGIKALALHEPDLGHTDITIESVWNEERRPDTVALESERLREYVGAKMMNNRLNRIVSRPDGPFTEAGMYNGVFLQHYGYASVSAKTKADDWQQALETLSMSLRQALESGFTQAEFERAVKEVQGQLEKDVQTALGRDSKGLAGQIIAKLNNDDVILSPQQEHELFTPLLADLTLDQVNETFRQLWKHDNRLVQVTGTAKVADDTTGAERRVASVYRATLNQALEPYQAAEKIVFPYLDLPGKYAGTLREEKLESLDASRYVLENGTVVNLKKTDFNPNEIMFSVQFGAGKLDEPVPGLGELGQAVVRESGVGGLDRDELTAALAGRNVRISFSVGDESFSLNGQGLSSELELLFQLIHSYLNDPAFRPEAYQLGMERFKQLHQQLSSTVEGVKALSGERFLTGGDSRYGMVPLEQLKSLTLEQVETWLRPVFSREGLEISLVGDFDPAEAARLAAGYFGMDKRKPIVAGQGKSLIFPAGQEHRRMVATEIDKGFLEVSWPTDDFWDISRTRRLNVLASVLTERARIEIREKMGAVYSSYAYNRSSRVDPGFGILSLQMVVDPKQVDTLADAVFALSDDLAANGIEGDELQRIVGPIMTSLKDMVRTNRYWLDSVLVLSSRHPRQLEWPLTLQQDFASVNAEEIQGLAKQYLVNDRAARIVGLPTKPTVSEGR